jgi:hypothetical protein
MESLEELAAYMSLINIDLLEYMCICKGYSDLNTKICLDIQEHGFNLRKIESHLLNLESDYSKKFSFLETKILELTNKVKIDKNIIPYGPAHVAKCISQRISKNFEGEIRQYLEKLSDYLYLLSRYINQNFRIYGEQEICIN